MRYFAFDPGDRWIGGVQFWQARDESWLAKSVLIDARRLSTTAKILLLHPYCEWADQIVVEDFRIRVQGHQAFSPGDTLRLLGATEFYTTIFGKPLTFMSPKSATRAFELWRRIPRGSQLFFPDGRARDHTLSAWRVLGEYFLHHDQHDILQTYTGARG